MYEICRRHQAGESCQRAAGILAKRKVVSQKVNTTIQQIQQNFNKVKKESKWVNTKCEAQLARSIEDKKWVTIVVNNVELQQKQTLVPVLTGVGKETTLCYSSPVRPPLETTNWENLPLKKSPSGTMATGHHLLKVKLKRWSLPII